ncbi:hypothetical protein AVEN_118970-1, partial [Araneus ventricosus]
SKAQKDPRVLNGIQDNPSTKTSAKCNNFDIELNRLLRLLYRFASSRFRASPPASYRLKKEIEQTIQVGVAVHKRFSSPSGHTRRILGLSNLPEFFRGGREEKSSFLEFRKSSCPLGKEQWKGIMGLKAGPSDVRPGVHLYDCLRIGL